jgi:WD40 repeat protein
VPRSGQLSNGQSVDVIFSGCDIWAVSYAILKCCGIYTGVLLEIQSNGCSVPKAAILHGQPVLCTAWKDDGSIVFSAGCDKQVKMWPILSGGQPVQVGMHDAPIKDIAWVPEMNLLVTGSWDKTIK